MTAPLSAARAQRSALAPASRKSTVDLPTLDSPPTAAAWAAREIGDHTIAADVRAGRAAGGRRSWCG